MRKRKSRTRFGAALNILEYVVSAFTLVGLIALIRHVILYHFN